MTVDNLLMWALALVLLGGLLIVVAYCLVRGVSFAYFRTRLEYLRKVRNLKRENTNGSV